MSKLELPPDIAREIMNMIKVESRPLGVLIIENCVGNAVHARIHEEGITQRERRLLRFREIKTQGSMRWYFRESGGQSGDVDELVYTALTLGFAFRGEPDRTRWKNHQPFEMYREAVRRLV